MPILHNLTEKQPTAVFQANIPSCNSNESQQSTPATAVTEIHFDKGKEG